uniref:Uncharacterized protein n=1 Tax=Glossina brevipalpis TaxID=37001 RepID=A0A1A9X0S2_9MUSC
MTTSDERKLSYIERKSEIIFITIQRIVLFFISFCISTIVWIGKGFLRAIFRSFHTKTTFKQMIEILWSYARRKAKFYSRNPSGSSKINLANIMTFLIMIMSCNMSDNCPMAIVEAQDKSFLMWRPGTVVRYEQPSHDEPTEIKF